MFSSKLVSAAELSAFLDGETEPSRRALLREHLRSSPGDAQRLARWRQREEALRATFAPAIREGAGPIAPLARSLDQKVFPRDRRSALRVPGTESQRGDDPIRNLAATAPDITPSTRQRLILIALLAFLAGAASMYAVTRLVEDQRARTQPVAPAAVENPADRAR